MKYHVRWGIRRDLPEILEIDRQSFADAWTEEDFLAVLRQRNAILYAIEELESEMVVGFGVVELHKKLLNLPRLAVQADSRRLGAGRLLLCKLIEKLTTGEGHAAQRNRLRVVVPERNLAGLVFLRSFGFTVSAQIPCMFGDDDGIKMVYHKVPAEPCFG